MNTQQRAKLIRNAMPNCLQELLTKQKGVCDLCNQLIQDSIFAHVDHSFPVIRYARAWDIAIEDAIRECNDLSNLRVVHILCNHRKKTLSREEWFARGLDKQEAPPLYSEEDIKKLKVAFLAHQSKAGKRGGEWAVLNNAGIHSLDYDGTEVSRRNGQRNVESGHLRSISSKGGKVSGAIQGQKNKESGFMSRVGKSISGEDRQRRCSKGGVNWSHERWHIRRNVISPTCKLCKENQSGVHGTSGHN